MICSVSFLSRVCVSLLYVLCFVLVCFFGGLSQLMFRVYPRLYSVFHSIPFSILFYSILFCSMSYLFPVVCFLFLVRTFVCRPLSGRGGCVSATSFVLSPIVL